MADIRIHSNLRPLGDALKVEKPVSGGSSVKPFGEVLKESISEVNKLQIDADRSINDLVTGKSKDIHETMIAISKADLAFRMTLQVRNKVIDAYQEIMRMTL